MIDFYYENVQSLAVFVSVFVLTFSMLFVDSNAVTCDSSYTPLLWWILIFFSLPTIIPLIKIKWLKITLAVLTIGAMIYVPIQYVLLDGCPGQEGIHYFIFSAMITVVVGTIMGFISVKSKESDEEILKRDYIQRKSFIIEKLYDKSDEEK